MFFLLLTWGNGHEHIFDWWSKVSTFRAFCELFPQIESYKCLWMRTKTKYRQNLTGSKCFFLYLAHINWHCITRLKAKHIKRENVWNYSRHKYQSSEAFSFFVFRWAAKAEIIRVFFERFAAMKEEHEGALYNSKNATSSFWWDLFCFPFVFGRNTRAQWDVKSEELTQRQKKLFHWALPETQTLKGNF